MVSKIFLRFGFGREDVSCDAQLIYCTPLCAVKVEWVKTTSDERLGLAFSRLISKDSVTVFSING
jgi:hypothetical protein